VSPSHSHTDTHAATIREANDRLREATSGDYMAGESDAALDALLADLQRLEEALRNIAANTDEPWAHEYAESVLCPREEKPQ